MKINIYKHKKFGFTAVELLIVIVILGILTSLAYVSYNGVQRRAAESAVLNDMDHIAEAVNLERVRGNEVTAVPDEVKLTKNVTVDFIEASTGTTPSLPRYSNLTEVQNAVLFHSLCNTVLSEPQFTTIHGATHSPGNRHEPPAQQTATLVLSCNDNVQMNSIQITSWASRTFNTPIQKQDINNYLNGLGNDDGTDYWYDRKAVYKAFFTEMMNRFEAMGGTFPVTKFWNAWCTNPNDFYIPVTREWGCHPKQDLPEPDPVTPSGGTTFAGAYCIQATHTRFPDVIFHLVEGEEKPSAGACS